MKKFLILYVTPDMDHPKWDEIIAETIKDALAEFFNRHGHEEISVINIGCLD